jgi:hypothetical protein
MLNLAMKKKIEDGEAYDLSKAARLGSYYVIPDGVEIEGLDLCDSRGEVWIWSAGKIEIPVRLPGCGSLVPPGIQLASTSTDLYQCEGVLCTFLR